MTPLNELLEVYKTMLEWSDLEPEGIEENKQPSGKLIELQQRLASISSISTEKVSKPEEGDIVELVPPPDPIGMWFLVYKVYSSGIAFILPLSPFYEFATPKDHLITVHRKPYIVQTDLGIDVPVNTFAKHFPGQPYRIAKAEREDIKKIQRILDGQEMGTGPLSLSVHEEFKNLEAERYSVILSSAFFGEIRKQEVSQIFESQKELSLAASEEEPLWGRKEDFAWTYDEEEEKLIIIPSKIHVGKHKKVVLKATDDEFTLFEGSIPEKIYIPLKRDSYSYEIIKEKVRIQNAGTTD